MKLPRLNSYVYVITYVNDEPYCVTRDKVFMKNKDSFITDDMLEESVIQEYKSPLSLEDYGDRWVKNFSEIKEVLAKCEEHWNTYHTEKIKYTVEKCPCGDKDWNIEGVVQCEDNDKISSLVEEIKECLLKNDWSE